MKIENNKTANEAAVRLADVERSLDAYDFDDTLVWVRGEDGSTHLYRNAFVVVWHNWYLIFHEHGEPTFQSRQDEDVEVMMLRPVYDQLNSVPKSYAYPTSIEHRRAKCYSPGTRRRKLP